MKQGISPTVAIVAIVVVVVIIAAIGYFVLSKKGDKQSSTLEETDRQTMMEKSFQSMGPDAGQPKAADAPE